MLHDDPGLALNGFQLPYQGRKSLRTVNYVKGQPYNLAKGTEYRYGAFSAGNINACCVHMQHSCQQDLQWIKAIFSHCRFHLFADTNAQALPAQIEHCECEGWLTDFLADV